MVKPAAHSPDVPPPATYPFVLVGVESTDNRWKFLGVACDLEATALGSFEIHSKY